MVRRCDRSTRRLFASLLFLTAGCATAGPAAAGEEELLRLLKDDCGSCHGLRLSGGLGPALTRASLDGLSDGALFEVIRNGRPERAMPPWKGILSDAEITTLVAILRTGKGEGDGVE